MPGLTFQILAFQLLGVNWLNSVEPCLDQGASRSYKIIYINVVTFGAHRKTRPMAARLRRRVIGPIRRECLDHMIVFNEASLYRHLKGFDPVITNPELTFRSRRIRRSSERSMFPRCVESWRFRRLAASTIDTNAGPPENSGAAVLSLERCHTSLCFSRGLRPSANRRALHPGIRWPTSSFADATYGSPSPPPLKSKPTLVQDWDSGSHRAGGNFGSRQILR
jgi:hypothetical protein